MTITPSLYASAPRPYVAGGSSGRGDLIARYLLTPSSNYVTGGDTVDLRGLSVPGINSPYEGFAFSNSGYVTHYYTFMPDIAATNSRANCKLKVTVAATQAELAAGAYPGGITGDTIVLECLYRFPE